MNPSILRWVRYTPRQRVTVRGSNQAVLIAIKQALQKFRLRRSQEYREGHWDLKLINQRPVGVTGIAQSHSLRHVYNTIDSLLPLNVYNNAVPAECIAH